MIRPIGLAQARVTVANLIGELVTRLFGFDVFISHTRDGKPYATSLERAMMAAGRRCFLDQSELHVGVPLRRRVAEALGRSGMLVVVVTEGARKAPWTIAEARFYRRSRPNDPIVPLAFGESPGAVAWAGINHDLFDAEAVYVPLDPGWRGRLALRRAALWDGTRTAFGAVPKAAIEEYLGVVDSPANLEAATPDPAVVARVVEAQRRLAVSSRARRGGLAALALVGILLASAGGLAARYYRNLPTERLDAARAALDALGYRVADDRRANYRVIWEAQESAQGPLGDETWRQASGPLRMLDRYANIESLELIYTEVADLGPIDGLTTLGGLKVLGGRVTDLAPITGLGRLESLALSDLRGIDDDDLDALRGLARLKVLNLTGCPGVTDRGLDRLAGLPLREVDLSYCLKVNNRGLAGLAGLPLENLTIKRTGARVDRTLVDLLLNLPKLKSVDVDKLPGDPSELHRLRELAGQRGLRVLPGLAALKKPAPGASKPPRSPTSKASAPSTPRDGPDEPEYSTPTAASKAQEAPSP